MVCHHSRGKLSQVFYMVWDAPGHNVSLHRIKASKVPELSGTSWHMMTEPK